jgi:acetylornithine/N-succinyldiaminopimelate aminotransferase
MTNREILELTERVIVPSYRRYPVAIVRGKGHTVWDADGNEYLDFASAFGTSNVGHCHPRVVEAVASQAERLLHVCNLYYIEEQARLASMLAERSFAEQVFFCSSGAEANEAAIKLARKVSHDRFGPGRHTIICMEGAFHGRTLGTLSATGMDALKEGFAPLVPGFTFVPFNDMGAVEAAIDETTCAVLVEPIQGVGGVIMPEAQYLGGLKALCEDRDLLLIFDEIQTGIGRTGHLFAYEAFGVPPHIMTVSKSLGGGLPIAAMMTSTELASHLGPGTHATTFGGNSLSCAAAIAVLEAIEADQLLLNCRKVGAYLEEALQNLQAHHPGVKEVRGIGLMRAVELDRETRPFVLKALERGVIIDSAANTAFRLLPPLTIGEAEVDRLCGLLDEFLTEAEA